MYEVTDNGKPAKYPECNVDPLWNNCRFDTFQQAIDYVLKWLGYPDGTVWQVSGAYLTSGYDYSGYGDIIKITNLDNI